jgi:hypothetical protein
MSTTDRNYRLWVNDAGTELYRLWPDSGYLEVCRRPHPGATWGPPELVKEEK